MFTIETIADSFNFPTSVAFGEDETIYVAESGLPFGGAPPGGRIWKLGPGAQRTCLIDGLRPPVNGLVFHEGCLIVSEGGYPGRIGRFELASNSYEPIVDGLPGFGNYQTNMVAVGNDGKFYFSQGAMTNSGIIGLDSYDLGWLKHVPHACDIPGYDIVLGGVSARTPDPRGGTAITGAFAPFGNAHPEGHSIKGRVPCTSAVMRCNPDGSELELVAWGLRNAYGLCFTSDGRLLAIDQGADARGSRPLANCPDALFEVRPGAWYGWPDFVCGRPVHSPQFAPLEGPKPSFVLRNHAQLPPPEQPLFEFDVNAAAVKFDIVPPMNRVFESDCEGHLIVALFGDEKPLTGPAGPRVGRVLLRIDPHDWSAHPIPLFGLSRPIDVRFSPSREPFVVDFGEFEITLDKGVSAKPATGKLLQLKFSATEV